MLVCRQDSNVQAAVPALCQAGYAVQTTESPFEAVAAHARDPFRAIVVDVSLLGDGGSSMFEVLRESGKEVYILAVLPPGYRDQVVKYLRSGVDSYAIEPMYIDELVTLVGNAFTRSSPVCTERLREDKLRSLGQFARGVAHSVNNPLTTLSGWLQIMLSDVPTDDPRRNTLMVMNQETDRIAGVVRDLLAFAGHPSPNRSAIDINRLLDRLLMDLEQGGKFRTVLFTRHLTPGIGTVCADEQQLSEACGTILRFCASRSGAGDEIGVATYPADGQVYIEMAHSGDALDPDLIEHLFDPFSTELSEEALYGVDNGNGLSELALPVSYGIINGLGGSLSITTDQPRGSSFIIKLPVSSDAHTK